MAFLTWTDEISVGVELFDKEHQQLCAFINKLHIGIKAGNPSKQLQQVLDGLATYTQTHFKHEEEYMRMYGYPYYQEHKDEHEKLIAKVQSYQEQLNSGKSSFTLDLMQFLKDWILHHIAQTDMKYREFFNGKVVS